MEDNKENAKQLAKIGAQAWLKAVTAPITAAISSALLTILPYILIVAVLIILFIGIYFAANEQADEYYDTSNNIGQRMGNLISLHGFKTIKEVEADEQAKFITMLGLYEMVFEFDTHDLSLLTQTVLFEGSNEERIYLSETIDDEDQNNESSGTSLDWENPFSIVWKFVKNIITNFQRGFSTSYAGQSQYLKANKNMFINAIALKKCKNIAVDVEQCYKGYLVAEYEYYKDWLIDLGLATFDPGVEAGYLVLKPSIRFGVIDIDLGFIGHYLGMRQDFLRFRTELISSFEQFLGLTTVLSKFSEFSERFHEALNIVFFGALADYDTKHFYYDGYIVQNLKEEYKVYKNDAYDNYKYYIDSDKLGFNSIYSFMEPNKELMSLIQSLFDPSVVDEETKNRKETAELILDDVDYFYELSHGETDKRKSTVILPTPGDDDISVGTSCSPIAKEDLQYFSSPTSNCSVNSCFGVYAGGWGCEAHKGIDVNAGSGIYSVCDGKVTKSGMYNDGSASAVEVECEINGKTYKIRYLHMPISDVNKWQVGDLVPRGTYLGQQGAVGKGVSGAHLHLDVSLNGEYVNPEVLVGNCSFSHDCDGSRDYCESVGQYYCKN